MNWKNLLLQENVGGYDLLIRSLAGTLAIIALAIDLVEGLGKWILVLIAVVGVFSGITRHCSLYSLINFTTAKKNKDEEDHS